MAALSKTLLTAFVVFAAAFPQSPAHATHTGAIHMVCDVNGDGALDNFDFRAIQAARGSLATGASDPRDPNRDGIIDQDDHRICVLRPMCLRQLSLKHRSPAACVTQPVNRPPVADAGADQSVFSGSIVTLNGSGSSDPDGDALSFSWRILSSPTDSSATLSDPGSVMPTFLADEDGQFVIELIVNDGRLDSAPDTVTITTQPINTPPVADAGPDQTVIIGATVTLDGSGSTDIDGDSLTFDWSFTALPAGSTATLSDPTAVSPTFVADIAGEFIVQLIVNDGQEDSAPDAVSIFTEQGNRAPIADAGPDQSAEVGDTITLDGSGSSDPDGDTLTYSWSFVSQPAGSTATIGSPDSAIASFMADAAGQYVVQLIVNDGSEDSEPDTALINIEIGNTPPVADAGPDQTATVGDTVLLDGSGSSDADGDALGFTWSFTSRPAGSQAALSDPSAPATSFVADVAGLYVVQLIVNDGTVDSAPDTANVTVEAVPNGDPIAVDDAATTDEDTATDIDVLANDSDTDGDPLSVTGLTQPANGSVTTDGSLVTYTPAPDFNGTDSFVYTISDDRGGTASATVTVEVAAVNDAPVAVDDSAETTADTPVTVAVLANDTDVDGDALAVMAVTDGANGTVTTDGTNATYTPAAGFAGFDSFTYTASDGELTDTAMVTVNVVGGGGGNLPPVAVDDEFTLAEDATATVLDVLANDTDGDGDPLTVTEVTQPANGTVVNNDTDVSYTPNPNFNGTDTFTYTISDGTDAATATVIVTVTPVNDAPVAVDDSAETTADTPVTIAVLANDTDVDGDALTVAEVTNGTNGTVSTDGTTVTYTPAAGFVGLDSFTYTASDGDLTDTATVTVNVVGGGGGNLPPVAVDDEYTLAEDAAATVLDVLANDTDADGDPLTITDVTQPANGTVVNNDTDVSYTPNPNFNGTDTFTYTISDGVETATATVTVTVTPVNDAPVAVDDSADTSENTPVTVAVLANDTDVDGDALSVTAVTDGANGTVSTDGTNVTYTPDAAFSGTDSFTYTVSDGELTDTATVTIDVGAVNDPPVANDDAYTVAEDAAATALDVLANDTDADGDSLTVSAVVQPTNGTVVNNGSSVSYTPAADFNGTDTFSYTVSDGELTDAATVTVTVTAVNDPPVAVNDSAETSENTAVTVAVLANDTDVDGDALSVAAVTDGANGTVTTDGTNVTYTPDSGFSGIDSFTYTASDGELSDTATVTVDVGAVNDPPIATDDEFSVEEDSGTTVLDVLGNDSDPDGDTLTVSSVTQPANGTATNTGTGVSYTPATNFNGTDTFTYTVSDGVETATATVTMTVTPVNDAPVATDDSADTDEDTPVTVAVLANDTDIDGDALTVTQASNGTNGTVTTDGTTVTYTPDSGFNGSDSFTYTVSDGDLTDTATVTVDVAAVNDPPVANDDTFTIEEDATATSLDVLSNDSDPDGDTLAITATTQPANGTVIINGTATAVSYLPDENFNGTDSFTYTVSDSVETATATVTVTVTPVNDAPVAQDDAVTTDEQVPVTVDVLANDTDVDGDTLSIDAVTQGTNGSVANNGTDVTYTPNAAFSGTDTFTYTVTDGALTDSATVTVTVNDVNQPPVADAGADQAGITTDVFQLDGSGSSDPDGDTLTYQWAVQTGPAGAAVTFSDSAVVNPTVEVSDAGTYVLSLTVSDATQSDTDTVTLTVALAPSISIDNASTAEGDSGTSTLSFTLHLSTPIDRVVTAQYATADNSATADSDYVAATGTATFAASTTTTTIGITINGDTDLEPNEQFFVNLTNAVNATIADAQAIGTITNDDVAPALSLTPPSLSLLTSETASLTVTLPTAAGTGGVVVTLSNNNAAVASVPASVTVNEGETSASFTVTAGTVAGSALVTAAASGFSADSSSVTVSARGLGIALDSSLVGVGRTIGGTVTLSQPAPAGGVEVTVASGNAGLATVTPGTLTIAEGATQAGFSVNGIAVGNTQISASAVGYTTANAPLSVTNVVISLGAVPTLAPGQSGSLPVSLSSAAGADLIINFTSSDPAIATVTASVTIPAGATVPAANPQVTGVGIGTATITATAAGYAPDSRGVTVTLTLNFNPATQSVVEGRTVNLTLNASAAAPAGGLAVSLGTGDESIATVVPTVTIPQGQLSVQVPVTGVAVGSTTLTATAPGVSPATATVNVTVAPPINWGLGATDRVGRNLQIGVNVTLGAAPPGLETATVTVSVDDPSRALVSLDATQAGSASVTFPPVQGSTTVGTYYLQGVELGTVTITASALGYQSISSTVTIDPAGFTINLPSTDFTTDAFAANELVRIRTARLEDFGSGLRQIEFQALRGGLGTVLVPVTSSDADVGVIATSPIAFAANVQFVDTAFDPIAIGTTTVAVQQPAGFTAVVQEISGGNRDIVATVAGSAVLINNVQNTTDRVGRNLQAQASVRLESTPPAPVNITLTVADPSLLVLSDNATTAGGATLTLLNVGDTNNRTIFLQGLAESATTQVTATAPGFADAALTVTLDPAGFTINLPSTDFTTDAFAANELVRIRTARLEDFGSGLRQIEFQALRAGLGTVAVPVTSSDTDVGVITTSPVGFTANVQFVDTAFDPIAVGTTTIAVQQPAGFTAVVQEISGGNRDIVATVAGSAVLINSVQNATDRVGRNLQAQALVRLESTPPAPVDITLTVADPSVLVLSDNATAAGSGTLVLTGVNNITQRTIFLQALAENVTTQVTATAPGFADAVLTVTLDPAGFTINLPSADFTTDAFAANELVRIRTARLEDLGSGLRQIEFQALRAGLGTVAVPVTSSNTGVGVITTSPVGFTANVQFVDTAFDPIAVGTTTIAVQQPAGFTAVVQEISGGNRDIVATVDASAVLINSVQNATDRVGRNLQVQALVRLESTPPAPVDITLTVADPSVLVLSDNATAAGSGTLVLTGVNNITQRTIFLQALAENVTTQVTATAPGFADAVLTVTLDPAGFTINLPSADFSTDASAANTLVRIRTARLENLGNGLRQIEFQALRAGLGTVSVPVTSSNTGVGVITTSPVGFAANVQFVDTAFDPLTGGTTTIAVAQPAGFTAVVQEISGGNRDIVATVTGGP